MMRILTLAILVGALWFILNACSTQSSLEKLKSDIITELGKTDGDFAIAFKDLTTGEQILINEKEVFHAASTMKTPVMIEVYRQAAKGILSLSDSVEVVNEFKSIVDGSTFSLNIVDDSEEELYHQLGSRKTIGELVYDMIIVSSNLATNLVIELVDAKKVTQTMRDLGAQDIMVLRGVEDQKAFDQGMSNTTTAYDLMVIFEKLAGGKAVDAESDQQMIKILLDQKFNEIIPARLPDDVKVAHKTGSITGVQHDSGIVILPDGRKYVLVTLSKNLKDVDGGIAAMATVSEMIYLNLIKS